MARRRELPFTDKPVTKLVLPPDEETAKEYQGSMNHRLQLLGTVALALAAAAIIVLPKG